MIRQLSLLVVVLAMLGGGAMWWRQEAQPKAPSYRTSVLEKGTITAQVSATGTLQAVTSIDVGSQVSGVINQVYVTHNSVVKKGQLLAQLDPSTYQTAITQAQASVSNAESSLANAQADISNARANVQAAQAAVVSAQATVEQARVGVASAQASISSAQGRLTKAEGARDNALKGYQRNQDLEGRELIALADLDTSQTAYSGAEADVVSAVADLETARMGLRSAEVNVAAKQTDVESARIKQQAAQELVVAAQARARGFQAQVTQAKATLRTAEINLERTTITSPIDGVVLDVAITAGQTVAAQLQAPNLFTLAQDLSQMQVETSVDEADISKVKQGAAATFTVDAFPDQSFQGQVTEVRQAPVSTSGVVTYLVIVRTSNPKGELKPGMTATVDIVERQRADVLKVPNEALSFRPPALPSTSASPSPQKPSTGKGTRAEARVPTVYTLQGGELVAHPVKVGLSDGVDTELVGGELGVGEEVVLSVLSADKGAARSSSSGNRGGNRGGPPGPPRMF